jgi:hypothetical protein
VNVLAQWVASRPQPRHALTELRDLIRERTGQRVRWQTLQRIAGGKATPKPKTARLIEVGTAGDVPAAVLLGLTSIAAGHLNSEVNGAAR